VSIIVVKKSYHELTSVCSAILEKLNVPLEHSNIIADSLVKADLRGVESHGIARLPTYVKRVKNGLINPQAKYKIISESNTSVVYEDDNGFGQVIGAEAMHTAVKKAKEHGVSIVSGCHTNHLGMLAYYVLNAINQDVIAIMTSNAPPAMAPWGGQKPLIGTNPFCVGIPATKHLPIVVDMATSIVARGKIRLAIEKQEPIPEGWALDEKGNPTTDPKIALNGSVLPLGGVKGYCLAILVEILSGILSDGNYFDMVKSSTDMSGPMDVSFFIQAIDISQFMEINHFKDRVDNLIEAVKQSPKASNVSEIFLPGEIEFKKEERRLKDGIPIKEEIWSKITNLSKEF
jgi:LDH2 family malate/lactate/ureidoglycolate dehydrogenase